MTNSDYWLMLFLLFSMNPDGFKEDRKSVV